MREVEAFKDHLRLKGAKEETIRGYEVAIKTLEPFARGKKYSELTEGDILAWLKRIEGYGSAHTRHDYKRRVKTFLRWIHQRESPLRNSSRTSRRPSPRVWDARF